MEKSLAIPSDSTSSRVQLPLLRAGACFAERTGSLGTARMRVRRPPRARASRSGPGGRFYERFRPRVRVLLAPPALRAKCRRRLIGGSKQIILPRRRCSDGLRAHARPRSSNSLREERRAIVMWINNHFKPSAPWPLRPMRRRQSRVGDPFVAIFVGEDRADVHASCHPCMGRRTGEPRLALRSGMETPVGIRPGMRRLLCRDEGRNENVALPANDRQSRRSAWQAP